ncbi:MAG: flippase [Xenococcaceae cyanobacterium MO_234.B1]|nr:flippase [Xenococcaceae cyanobacterium MO_234.B1]
MPIKNKFAKSDLLLSLFRGAAIALGLQLSGIAVSYAMQVLLARWMGATQYGVYDYVISIGTFLGFLAGLGLPNCLLRFIPEYSVKEDWGKLRGIVWGSWRYVFTSSILIAFIGIAILVSWQRDNSEVALVSFLLGISTVPLWALIRHQQEMARGIKRMALAYFPSKVMFPLLVVVGAFYYRHHLSSSKALAIAFLSLSLVLVSQLWLFSQQMPRQCFNIQPIYSPKEWFAVALPLLFNGGAFVVLSQTDIIMTGAILGSFQVGIYSAAFKTASAVSFILAAVNAIAAPMFATLHAQGDYKGLQKLTATVARWLFYPSLVFALFLIVFADRVLGLFGSEFVAARWEMTILILGQLVNVGTGSVGYLMEMTGHHNKCAYVFGCSAILNVMLNGILIPTLGIMGAAIATAVTMATWNIWLHQLVVKHIGVQPSIISTF